MSSAESLAQRNNSLDEFMSLTGYFDDSQNESDIYYDSRENMDNSGQDLALSDDDFSTLHSQDDVENSYGEDLNFSTDFEDLNDNFNNENDGEDYGDDNRYYYEDDEFSYEQPRSYEYLDDDYAESPAQNDYEVISVDDDTPTYDGDDDDDDHLEASGPIHIKVTSVKYVTFGK